MDSIRWRETSEEFPCSVCGKAGWCSGSDDGVWAICRRKEDGTGEHKVDASGADYWLYKLNESSGESVPKDDPPKVPERAAPETLDRVYGVLLDELPLSHSHRHDLHRRGLSEREIKRRGYCTLPSRDREGRVASSRRDSRRTELGGQRQGVEKQEKARWRASEHAYRDKERDERAEEDHSPVVCATFLVGGGRGS